MDKLSDKLYRLAFYESLIPCLLKGGFSHDNILMTLKTIHDKYSDDYTEEQLEADILGYHALLLEKGGYKERRNVQQEVENLIEFRGNGIMSLVDFYSDLKLDSREEKASCRMALNRLSARKKIEKIESGRTGTYRLVDTVADRIQFIDGDSKRFPVKLPLDLNALCNIYPKNIIIIAGSKSSGKTAFLLTTAMLNQNHIPVVYLNSDMGDEEYTDRLKKMGFTCQEDIKFNALNRSHSFHDLITPEQKIFIIDFLEVHENFYEIGKPIKQIWDKLKDGIAIIAIQMKSGAKVGRGGDFSKEKARLYLAMDYVADERCKRLIIEEAKSPAAAYPDGVRGWSRKVKIINGSQFHSVEEHGIKGWHG